MFYSLFGKLQERGFDHFMILESPALPIRKHWLDAIAKAATQEKCALDPPLFPFVVARKRLLFCFTFYLCIFC